jgi:hypothetical protein
MVGPSELAVIQSDEAFSQLYVCNTNFCNCNATACTAKNPLTPGGACSATPSAGPLQCREGEVGTMQTEDGPSLALTAATPGNLASSTYPAGSMCSSYASLNDDGSSYTATCEPHPDGEGPRRICTDPGGKLYAKQRAADELPADYAARIAADVAAAPGEYLVRQEIARLGAELDEHRRDVWAEAAGIVRDGKANAYAPRNTDACYAFNRACDFWPVCFGGASLDDPQLYKHVEDLHTELTPPGVE